MKSGRKCVEREGLLVCVAGHSKAPRRRFGGGSQHWVVIDGWVEGGDKAKVYESKGTPNYSYTIHDKFLLQ